MIVLKAAVFSLVVTASWCQLDFPPGFKFGAASAAYQVEGAWNVSDKGESIWDRYTHEKPEAIADGSNGDVACDSYNQYKRDVEIAKELGLHFYRFSINWPRLLPSGYPNRISEDGKNYYNNLIDELLKNGIEPLITLYHWELPQTLQDLGGWANPLIADWFADYARVAFSLYGDRVKTWLTINEPIAVCDCSYCEGLLAPAIDSTVGQYLCSKNVIMAHAKAWRVYDEEFRSKYGGQVSIANQLFWYEPSADSDKELTDLTLEYANGRYSHPIFSKEGGWPPSLEKFMAKSSKKLGYPRSRLPAFTKEEKEFARGTYDFYALNHYTSRLVRQLRDGEVTRGDGCPLLPGLVELGIAFERRNDWPVAANGWLFEYPEGIRHQLNWLKKQYGNMKFMITENGYARVASGLEDDDRVNYYKQYLKQVLLAIKEDGVDVFGYTAWTLIDNFEWVDGYRTKFGLYEVDFEDPLRSRKPRKSARYYASVIKSNSLDDPNKNIYEEL